MPTQEHYNQRLLTTTAQNHTIHSHVVFMQANGFLASFHPLIASPWGISFASID